MALGNDHDALTLIPIQWSIRCTVDPEVALTCRPATNESATKSKSTRFPLGSEAINASAACSSATMTLGTTALPFLRGNAGPTKSLTKLRAVANRQLPLTEVPLTPELAVGSKEGSYEPIRIT